MQPIKNLNDMIVFLQQRGDKKRVAVVCANDASTRYAVEKGQEMGFIEPVYVDGDDKEECARRAVALCKSGEADILMKGLINTDVILRAILDRETGILRPGHVLTHVAMAEILHRCRRHPCAYRCPAPPADSLCELCVSCPRHRGTAYLPHPLCREGERQDVPLYR